jgi:hypothetical protein
MRRREVLDSGTAQKKYFFAKARRKWLARAAYSAGATKPALAFHGATLEQSCLRFNGNRSKVMFGNTTTCTGPQGQYMGSSNTFGNTATLTGPQGQYQGSVTTFPGAPTALCRFRLLTRISRQEMTMTSKFLLTTCALLVSLPAFAQEWTKEEQAAGLKTTEFTRHIPAGKQRTLIILAI